MRAAIVLSLFWFAALGGLGVFFPYYSLYLSENAQLSGRQVGMVMATLPLVGMIAQPFWGYVADVTGSRTRVLGGLCGLAACGHFVLFSADGFYQIIAATAALAMFATAVLPTCVSVTLAMVAPLGPHSFGLVRVWGTVGYLVTVVAFPLLLHVYQRSAGLARVAGGPSEPGLEIMLIATGVLALLAGLCSIFLPREGAVAVRAERHEWRRLLRHGPFLKLLFYVLCAYTCLQGPMALFPIYVRSLGGDIETVSRMWVFMLVLEIPLVVLSGAGLARFGARGLIGMGVAAGALRWLVCGLTTSLPLIYAVQVLHGLTVLGLIIGGPLYVEAIVPANLRSTGQGMLAMFGLSVGGILSNLWSGYAIDLVGPAAPALFGGIFCSLLVLALPWALPNASPVDGPGGPALPSSADNVHDYEGHAMPPV